MEKAMIIRTIVLAVALLNQVLVTFGWSPLPFDEDTIEQGLTAVFTVVATLWAYWKNNSFTDEGKEADRYLEEMKQLKRESKGK